MLSTTMPSAVIAAIAAYLQPPIMTPTPFPETAMKPTQIPTQVTTFHIAFTVGTQLFTAPVTISGPGPGVVSGISFGAAMPWIGSKKVFGCGQPFVRSLLDASGTNGVGPVGNGVAIIMPNQCQVYSLI